MSGPNNDSAILKSIKRLFVNLNLVNDEINNILTEDVVANKILMQSLNLLSVKHRELCLLREEYLQNGVKFKATSKIKDCLEELESAEKYIRSALIEMSNIKIQAALDLDVLTFNVQRKKQKTKKKTKKLSSLCVIKAARLQMLLDNRKLSHDLKRRINKQTKQKNLDDEETLTNMKFECINTLALSWPDALENIIEKQNVRNYINGPLSD